MEKHFWDYNIQSPPEFVLMNWKKIRHQVFLAVPLDLRIKMKESEKTDWYLEIDKELKKAVEHEHEDGSTNICSP